jgi:hypothetical protein
MSRLENRRAIISSAGIPERCVLCEHTLAAPEQARYMMINAEGEAVVCQQQTWFCEHCPPIYLDEKALNHVAELFEYDPYALVGFIDDSQIPADKRDLPLGEDPDLPVPLVEFSAVQPLTPGSLNF